MLICYRVANIRCNCKRVVVKLTINRLEKVKIESLFFFYRILVLREYVINRVELILGTLSLYCLCYLHCKCPHFCVLDHSPFNPFTPKI